MTITTDFNSLPNLIALNEGGACVSTFVVFAYLREKGAAPIGLIAKACKLSERSVQRALAAIKRFGLPTTKMSHDHDHGDHVNKGTASDLASEGISDAKSDTPQTTNLSAVPVFSDTTDAPEDDKPVDPIREKLIQYEVYAWCVDNLMAKVDRKVIERQLEYHAFRLAHNFKFAKHPATYLHSSCLRDFVAPDGFHATAYKARTGIKDAPKVVQLPVRPEPQPEAPLDDVQKLDTLRKMMAQPFPSARRIAAKLAMEWGMSPEDLASAAG